MAKIARLITVDYEVWEAAKATGHNLSEICEQALMSVTNKKQILLSSVLADDDKNEFLNRMVNAVSSSPTYASSYARMIRDNFGFKATPQEVINLTKELMKNG